MSQEPPNLRELDTSKARKSVVLTRTQPELIEPPNKDLRARQRRRRNALLLSAGTCLLSSLTLLMMGYLVGGIALSVLCLVLMARHRHQLSASPSASDALADSPRIQQFQQRLEEADLHADVHQELQGAMLDLLSAQKRQEEAAQSIESTLKSLSPGTLRTALATAETGGDAVEIRFRQQAVETYEDLVERRERMEQGIARTEAALDALMLALAQATAPDPQAANSVEADSLRLVGQIEALRHATAELDALETDPSPPGRGRERA